MEKIERMEVSEVVPGTVVIYWHDIKEDGSKHRPVKTKIQHWPFQRQGEEAVCYLEGLNEPVPISHLDSISPGSLIAAKLRGLQEISSNDIKYSIEEFFATRGVTAIVTKW